MKTLKMIYPIFIIAIVWHFGVILKIVDAQFFPSPLVFFKRLIVLFSEKDFLFDCYRSLYRLTIGACVSIPLSFLLALGCVHFKWMDKFINPIVAFTYPLPKVALFPLILLIFGIGDTAKIFIIALGMFYLLFINLRFGFLKLRSGENLELVQIFHIKKSDYLIEVLFKGIRDDFLSGLKLALGYGLTLVVVSEFSMSRDGIGNFIWKAWDQFKVVDMYAGVLLLSITGFLIYFILEILIQKFKFE